MNTTTKNVVLLACASAAFVGSYLMFSARHTSAETEHAHEASAPSGLTPYPAARFWRDPESLSRVVVDLRHILIAHSGSSPIATARHMPIRRVTRSRAEAEALARRLAAELGQHPASFESYARRYSDDEATAPFDGSFGPARVTVLPYELVNVLASVAVDEVSRPVETSAGFHVVVRRAQSPNPERFAAQQIHVAYDGASGTVTGASIGRTREEARTLAERLRAQAQRDPASFAAIAQAQGQTRNLDWGAATRFAPSSDPLAILALSRVRVGEITDVVDTAAGFLVLLRTDDTERERLVAAFVGVAPERARETGGTARVRSVRALAGTTPTDLATFAATQTRLCAAVLCEDPIIDWERGDLVSGPLEQAVLATPIGHVSNVVESELGTFVVYRIDPSTIPTDGAEPTPAYATELPDNGAWTFEEHLARLPTGRLVLLVRQFQTQVVAPLDVTEEQRVRTLEAVERLAQGLERVSKPERAALYASCEHDVREILGASGYAKLERAREAWFVSMSRL